MRAEHTRRHRGLYWTAVLAALLLLVGGLSYGYAGYRDTAGPEGAVRGYLGAVARGDAEGALAYGTIPVGSRAFLTRSVLDEQLRIAPMRDVVVLSSRRSGDTATVTFSYDLAFSRGEVRVTDKVGLTHSGSRWLLDRVAASPQLLANQANQRITLAGARLPDTSVLLFPGAVPVRFDTPYLRLTLDTGQIRLSASGSVSLNVELTAAATSALQGDVAGLLADCGSGRSAAQARCPVPNDQTVPGSLIGTFHDDAEELELSVDINPAGSVAISGSATFTGKYRTLDFDDVPHAHTGELTVPFTAAAYAVRPLRVQFTVPA